MRRLFDKISVYRLRVPLVTPYRLSFGAVEFFDTLVVETVNHDGNIGLGEATVLTGYTDETIDDSWRVSQQFAGDLAICNNEVALSKIRQLGEKFPFTATAFSTALDMLAGSAFLRLKHSAKVPLVGLLHATTEDAMHPEFERLLADGYRTIKVKIGFDVAQDTQLIRTVQKVFAGRARIRIDANQGYTADQGVAFARMLDPTGIELFEQPCAAGDWDSHLAVARVAQVPMMLDESIYGIADIERAARLEAAAYIKVKLMKLVTLAQLAQAIERIKALGMKPVLGNGVACDLGCWMEGCVASRYIDNAGEMNGFLKARGAVLIGGLEFRDGAMVLTPDFAPRLDMANIKKYLVDSVVHGSCLAVSAAR